jgi:hypothetical protein
MFAADWATAGPGAVFFLQPDGFVAATCWNAYLNISIYVGLFMACGNNEMALRHSWDDEITTKDYWRKIMEAAKMRMPRELARWDNDHLEKYFPFKNSDIVVKLTDSFLGIGDQFLVAGKDFETEDDVEKFLGSTTFPGADGKPNSYQGKQALILEKVKPDPLYGVHSLDILTMTTVDGPKVVSILYWGDCTGPSSHTCRAGYTVNLETEKIEGKATWYSPFFAKQKDDLIGTHLPGLKETCQKAIDAHANCGFPWLRMIGWDAMIMPNDEIVFFEGNFASARLPRRMFLAKENTIEYLTKHLYSTIPGLK